ncbi:O-antigen ligase family protein [Vibrio scophthalmi]|uniref:O-antigen ligase family protein n=1 Tax=Vibrio scophthalmi TaxID=45658 RepID=UPI003AAE5AD4
MFKELTFRLNHQFITIKMHPFNNIERQNTFNTLMLLCIMVYAILKYSFRVYGDIFQTIFVISFIFLCITSPKPLISDNVFKLFIAALGASILSWINAKIQLPHLARELPDIGPMFNLFYFLPIAFFLQGKSERVTLLWFAMLTGFIVSFISHSPDFIGELLRGANGVRISFGVNNAQHPAIWSGVAIIVLIAMIIKEFTTRSLKRPLYWIAYIGLLLFFTFVLIATQTRQVLLGLTLSISLGSLWYVYIKRIKASTKRVVFSILLLLIVLFSIGYFTGVEKRIESEQNTLSLILSGQIDNLPDDSTGIRMSLWSAAFDWVQERPLLGSDFGVDKELIKTSKKTSSFIKDNIHHLHNSFVDISVYYGLLGLAIISLTLILVFRRCMASDKGLQFNPIQYACCLFFVYWVTVNMFESYLFSTSGLLVHNIMLGSFFTFMMHNNGESSDR